MSPLLLPIVAVLATGCEVKRRGAAVEPAPPAVDRRPIGETPVTIEGGAVIRWTPTPSPIPLNDWFDLRIEITPPGAARLVTLEATMPEHAHGMNVIPTLRPTGPGAWRGEGLLWHMPGDWELRAVLMRPEGVTEMVRWRVPCCDG